MRISHVLAFACLFSFALAGCMTNTPQVDDVLSQSVAELLSPPQFGIMEGETAWIESSFDGALMHATVWLPAIAGVDPAWKSPVILVDTPYRTLANRALSFDEESELTTHFNPDQPTGSPSRDWLIERFVPAGYAVVFKEVRGTGDSGGCWQGTGPLQWQDGYDSIEWLAAQPWSNGNVGMYGLSYDAETQISVAGLAPHSLKTIIPIASVSSLYEYNFYGGVPRTANVALGAASYTALSVAPPPLPLADGTTGMENYGAHFECSDEHFVEALDDSGDLNQYWNERDLRPGFANFEASVLYVHGLLDWNVETSALLDSFEHVSTEKRMILGQWHHTYPERFDYASSDGTQWYDIVHAWYDYELLGIENGIQERLPPVHIQDSMGNWREAQGFPPILGSTANFYLTNQGLSKTSSMFDLTLDEDLAGTPMTAAEISQFLAEDAAGIGLGVSIPRPDHLSFMSAPLDASIHATGFPRLHFTVSLTDEPLPDADSTIDAHFAAHLEIANCPEEALITKGYASARHREGIDAPKDVAEGEALTYEITFLAMDTVIPAGCQLELWVAGSDEFVAPQGTGWRGHFTLGQLELDLAS